MFSFAQPSAVRTCQGWHTPRSSASGRKERALAVASCSASCSKSWFRLFACGADCLQSLLIRREEPWRPILSVLHWQASWREIVSGQQHDVIPDTRCRENVLTRNSFISPGLHEPSPTFAWPAFGASSSQVSNLLTSSACARPCHQTGHSPSPPCPMLESVQNLSSLPRLPHSGSSSMPFAPAM